MVSLIPSAFVSMADLIASTLLVTCPTNRLGLLTLLKPTLPFPRLPFAVRPPKRYPVTVYRTLLVFEMTRCTRVRPLFDRPRIARLRRGHKYGGGDLERPHPCRRKRYFGLTGVAEKKNNENKK